LACTLNKEWKMLVSDIDDENIHFATRNINQNNLQERIESDCFVLNKNL
jgi:hypothetical protein